MGTGIREVRDRHRTLRVVVSEAERGAIQRRAVAASLSVSAYLRAAGLSQTIRSTLDHKTVMELAKVNADQGRLGGLLKLWLAERPGDGAAIRDVRAMLDRIGELQARLADLAGRA